MPSKMKLLLTTSLLVSIGFGSATVLAQTAAGAPATAQAPGQPGAAPQPVMSPQMQQNQKMIQDAIRQAQEAQNKAREVAERMRIQSLQQAIKPGVVQTPQQKDARAEQVKQMQVDLTPEVKAAREKEAQILAGQVAALRAAQEAQAKAAAAEQNAIKLKNDALAFTKPNPASGANFTPQNVMPLLQGLDNLTKRLNAVKTPSDLPAPQMGALAQELSRLSDYMDKVEKAMDGVQLAGVETPANKEAAALFARTEVLGKNLDAEMLRIEKLFPNAPQLKAMFAKFRE